MHLTDALDSMHVAAANSQTKGDQTAVDQEESIATAIELDTLEETADDITEHISIQDG